MLQDYRHILEMWVLLTGPGFTMELRTCCCSTARSACAASSGRSHDTRWEGGAEQESSSAEEEERKREEGDASGFRLRSCERCRTGR